MKRYDGEHIEVTYDTARCLHAAECVRGMPAVFMTAVAGSWPVGSCSVPTRNGARYTTGHDPARADNTA